MRMPLSRRALVARLLCAAPAAAIVLAAVRPSAAASAPWPPDRPVVTTLAGTGEAGLADGPRLRAQFVMPTGVAYAPNGDLVVADSGAQRIRIVGRDGIVRTIAGGGDLIPTGTWVRGGYADGPAAQARFRRPFAVAVDRAGAIFVADADNRAIRKIANGVVTTVAGAPTRKGAADGPAAAASFTAPFGIAVDGNGNCYVADTGVGLRRIARDGSVSTLHVDGLLKTVSAVSILPGSSLLFVTDRGGGITIVDVRDPAAPKRAYRWAAPGTEGDVTFGMPYAVAPIDATTMVYTDIYTHAIRFFEADKVSPYSRILSGESGENPQVDGSGFRDGPGEVSRFDTPTAVVRSPRGTFVVADAANKRVRELSAFDERSGASEPRYDVGDRAHEYRIAILGNSFVWTGSPPSQTSAGYLERALDAEPAFRARGKTARVYPIRRFGIDTVGAASYLREFLADGQVDAVLFLVNHNVVGPPQDFAANLRALNEAARRAHVLLVAATVPYAYELGPQETLLYAATGRPEATIPPAAEQDYEAMRNQLNDAVRASGIPFADGWDAFARDVRSPDHRALYIGGDIHLSPHGNEVLAAAAARVFATLKP